MVSVFAFRKKQKGVASIEFVLGFMSFWLMCVAWVEISYISYVSAMGDLAISRAAREVKTADDPSTDYLMAFKQAIADSSSIWSHVIDPNQFSVSVHYLKDMKALTQVTMACKPVVDPSDPLGGKSKVCGGDAKNKAIAIYRLTYHYHSIFTVLVDINALFVREVIVLQEYQRDKFD